MIGGAGDDILVTSGAGALALAQVDEGFAQALYQSIGNADGSNLDAAIDEAGQMDPGDAVAVADALAQIDELANGGDDVI
ncbi:MAG: hypothetical protein HOE62_03525 [Alphaproteobacteria bacterium]|jgi:hypothetical protein|nr:hypothetical protein [Alphaproteobacteria bacterium]MBT4016996.1 hypothetical protein [Alphaproteobacteria bacterium]MBT5160342.1 hypothetical protein [Alphaproteobacteria bacterium]MBT6385336.1 hypothetical protein [Alphaproteobacteria bacterium]MBT7747376.1 hypothetical protein [Alphaproteobacteria bacterium]